MDSTGNTQPVELRELADLLRGYGWSEPPIERFLADVCATADVLKDHAEWWSQWGTQSPRDAKKNLQAMSAAAGKLHYYLDQLEAAGMDALAYGLVEGRFVDSPRGAVSNLQGELAKIEGGISAAVEQLQIGGTKPRFPTFRRDCYTIFLLGICKSFEQATPGAKASAAPNSRLYPIASLALSWAVRGLAPEWKTLGGLRKALEVAVGIHRDRIPYPGPIDPLPAGAPGPDDPIF